MRDLDDEFESVDDLRQRAALLLACGVIGNASDSESEVLGSIPGRPAKHADVVEW